MTDQQTSFTVVAAVVNTMSLTLFNPKGETYVIPQSDPKMSDIVNSLLPILNEGKTYTLDLTKENPFMDMTTDTGGLIKFFKVARKSIANLFGRPDPDLGSDEKETITISSAISVEEMAAKIAEISANTTILSSDMSSDNVHEDETIVAVIDNKIVPDMENLAEIINHNYHMKNYKGTERLIQRLSNIISERQHSVKDALKFIAKSDLEIALDGSIIGYKLLRLAHKPVNELVTYLDCHSKSIVQHVGSRVFMDPKLVDPNRRKDCSHGLHVARRGYLRNFNGDVCVLVKINPEDIIAVPEYDANKVRVSGYTILAELSSSAKNELQSNRPMTNELEGRKLLAQAVNGTLEKIIHTVEIKDNNGTLEHKYVAGIEVAKTQKIKKSEVSELTAIDDKKVSAKAAAINVQDVANRNKSFKAMSNVEKIGSLYNTMVTANSPKPLAQEIMDIKRKCKKSWFSLGMSALMVEKVQSHLKPTKNAKEPPKASATKAETVKAKPKQSKPVVVEPKVTDEAYAAMTNAQKAQYLYVNDKIEALWELKRRVKVSWDKLGVPEPDKK